MKRNPQAKTLGQSLSTCNKVVASSIPGLLLSLLNLDSLLKVFLVVSSLNMKLLTTPYHPIFIDCQIDGTLELTTAIQIRLKHDFPGCCFQR